MLRMGAKLCPEADSRSRTGELDQPVRIGCGDDDLADLIGCRWHPAPSIRQPAPWPSIPVNGVAQRAPGNAAGNGGMAMVVLAGAGSRAVTSRPPSGSAP